MITRVHNQVIVVNKDSPTPPGEGVLPHSSYTGTCRPTGSCYLSTVLLCETSSGQLWASCRPKHVMWQRLFRGASEFKARNLFGPALVLASFISACNTVLISPNEDETAVHGYGLSLSVLVVLMSRKAHFST